MPLLLDKILTVLVLPLGVAVGTGLLALAALALGRRRGAAGLTAFAVVWLWVWSTPFPTRALVGPLADPYPIQPVEMAPVADAIVLLGGGIKPIRGDMIYPDLADSADRIWHAARLYHAGKAPLIIVSSGNVLDNLKQPSRAGAMRMLLDALGVPDDAMVIEDSSRNTRQNAVFTERLATARGIERVLLVTSHWHLRRAEAVFRRVDWTSLRSGPTTLIEGVCLESSLSSSSSRVPRPCCSIPGCSRNTSVTWSTVSAAGSERGRFRLHRARRSGGGR